MKALLLVSLLLVLCTSAAGAAGLNLGWNFACPTTASASVDASDPCDSNANLYTLVGSVRAPAGLTKVTAEEIVVDFDEMSGSLSPWWRLEDQTTTTPGGCRGTGASNPIGSLVVNTDFTGASTSVCRSYFGAASSGGFLWLPNFAGMDCARLEAVFARPQASAGPLTAGLEYYAFRATIDTRHTVPDPTDPSQFVCPGCQDGLCILFVSCKLDQPPGTPSGDIEVSTRDVRELVTWQNAGGGYCFFVSPVRRATWGKVKSLYL